MTLTNKERQQLTNKLRSLLQNLTYNELAIGDMLLEVRTRYGMNEAINIAEAVGWDYEKARQRIWVAERIPPGDWKRDPKRCPLTFSHLRALAKYGDVDAWAKKAVQEQWTIRQLKDALRDGDDRRFERRSYTCANPACNAEIDWADDNVLAVSPTAAHPSYFCGWMCVGIVAIQRSGAAPKPPKKPALKKPLAQASKKAAFQLHA
jgi:hypothetical protein